MVEIFDYKKGDQVGIAEIEKECFGEPWSEKAVIEAADYGTRFFVAKEGDLIVGYIGIKPIVDEGYIANVAVTEKFRNKKVGSMLLSAVDRFSVDEGLKTVSLEVRVSNTPAIGLYTKFGYENAGRRKGFYINPTEDALILTKKVQS